MSFGGQASTAATWFLSWLLVFQCGFALVAPLPSVPRPSFGRLLLLSLAVAVVQLLASLEELCLPELLVSLAAGPAR